MNRDQQPKYTYRDYLENPHREQTELIRGQIRELPMPDPSGQKIIRNLRNLFMAGLPKGKAVLLTPPFEVLLSPPDDPSGVSVVRPALCVVCDENKPAARGCDLVVELFSPGAMDTKLRLYEAYGVKEYWVVNPVWQSISVFVLQDDIFGESRSFAGDDVIESALFPELKAVAGMLFYGLESAGDSSLILEEPVTEYGQLDPERLYTYWDYLRWQFTERVELIRGRIFKMSPAPNRYHQEISMNLTGVLLPVLGRSTCKLFSAPFDVRLSIPGAVKDTTVVQPDLCVVCNPDKLDTQGCNGAPDLVVEILSPENTRHDTKTKFGLYEQSGVKEYWIVDPKRKSVAVYSLREAAFGSPEIFISGQIVQSPLFLAIQLDVDDVFVS